MKKLIILLAGFTALSGYTQSASQTFQIKENNDKSYAIQLAQVADESKFADYRQKLDVILKQSGGYIERIFDMDPPRGNIEGFEQMNRALVIFYGSNNSKSKDALKKLHTFLATFDFKVITFNGFSALSETSDSNWKDRFYLMKISHFKDNAEGREEMLTAMGPILEKYAFKTERMLRKRSSKDSATPDEIAIHYHDSAEQAGELQQDSEAMEAIGQYNSKYVNRFAYFTLRLR